MLNSDQKDEWLEENEIRADDERLEEDLAGDFDGELDLSGEIK